MRILIIHNHYKQVGGEDTVFYAESALLEEYGHTVDKLSFSNREVNSFYDNVKAAVGLVYNFNSAHIVEEKIESFRPDVIHVHNFFPLISPSVFYVAKKYGVPIVMTLHNYRLICPSSYLFYDGKSRKDNVHKVFPLKAIKDKAYRDSSLETAAVVLTTGLHKLLGTWQSKVDSFITLTQGAANLFLDSSLKLKPSQVTVKPNFTADLGVGQKERGDYFLYVGRLSPEKGLHTLLKAHAKYNFKLKIVGDGTLRDEVVAHACKYPSLEYLGYQDRDRVIFELKGAKAVIFPSEWLEMFGMTIIEAFSTATPVIASKIGGGEYLVTDGYNGLHYEPGNVDELVQQVRALEEDPGYADALGRSARKEYEERYTPEANYEMLLQIYEDVTGKKKKQQPVVAPMPVSV